MLTQPSEYFARAILNTQFSHKIFSNRCANILYRTCDAQAFEIWNFIRKWS